MFEIMNIGLHSTKPTKLLKKQEISQINKSYEFFIMDQSSNIIRTYSYTETNVYYRNVFKRCMYVYTFHNLLFSICFVYGLNQILEYKNVNDILIYMPYFFACHVFSYSQAHVQCMSCDERYNQQHWILEQFSHVSCYVS